MFDRTIVLGTNAAYMLAPVAAQAPAPTTTAFDGTYVGQLIQELAREGLYAVTHYKPQSDKVMRMHATGSAHIPSTIQRESSVTNARCQPQSSPDAGSPNCHRMAIDFLGYRGATPRP